MTNPVGFDWFDPTKTQELMAERQKLYSQESGASGGVSKAAPTESCAELPKVSALVQRWIEALPRGVRPCLLRAKFPRVLEALEQNWSDPALLNAEFKRLLIDDRGSRQGFPFVALQELHRLRDYYFEQLNPSGARKLDNRSAFNDQSR